MFCKKCGTAIRLNAKFCAKCGTPVPVAPPVKKEPVAPPPVEKKPVAVEKKPAEDVETLFNRKEDTRTRTEPVHEPEKKTEGPEVIIHMDKTKASSSNGQFHEWFSEPGDL